MDRAPMAENSGRLEETGCGSARIKSPRLRSGLRQNLSRKRNRTRGGRFKETSPSQGCNWKRIQSRTQTGVVKTEMTDSRTEDFRTRIDAPCGCSVHRIVLPHLATAPVTRSLRSAGDSGGSHSPNPLNGHRNPGQWPAAQASCGNRRLALGKAVRKRWVRQNAPHKRRGLETMKSPATSRPTKDAQPRSLHAVVGPTAREIYKETTRNRSYVKKLRRIGASNYEIANALGIKETDPVLQE